MSSLLLTIHITTQTINGRSSIFFGGVSIPKIFNLERNIFWQLDLVFNDYIDISKDRHDSQCWIPFDFLFDVRGNRYKYQENGTCLTVWETKKIINGFQDIISIMKSNTERDICGERYKPFEHTSYEAFFDIKISDADVDLLEIELWINMAYLKQPGYDMGFRFIVTLREFVEFTESLNSEFKSIMSIAEQRN